MHGLDSFIVAFCELVGTQDKLDSGSDFTKLGCDDLDNLGYSDEYLQSRKIHGKAYTATSGEVVLQYIENVSIKFGNRELQGCRIFFALGSRGRRFNSCHSDQLPKPCNACTARVTRFSFYVENLPLSLACPFTHPSSISTHYSPLHTPAPVPSETRGRYIHCRCNLLCLQVISVYGTISLMRQAELHRR